MEDQCFTLARWDNIHGSSAGSWLVREVPGVVLTRSREDHGSKHFWKIWVPSFAIEQKCVQAVWPKLGLPGVIDRQAWIKARPGLQKKFPTRTELLSALMMEQAPEEECPLAEFFN